MDDSVRTSRCWGVTVWTVALFSAFLAFGFLFLGAEPVTMAVAAG